MAERDVSGWMVDAILVTAAALNNFPSGCTVFWAPSFTIPKAQEKEKAGKMVWSDLER